MMATAGSAMKGRPYNCKVALFARERIADHVRTSRRSSPIGISRNSVIIDVSHAARSTSVTCVVPGSTASRARGRPTRSPDYRAAAPMADRCRGSRSTSPDRSRAHSRSQRVRWDKSPCSRLGIPSLRCPSLACSFPYRCLFGGQQNRKRAVADTWSQGHLGRPSGIWLLGWEKSATGRPAQRRTR